MTKLQKALVYATSRQGIHDISAAVTGLVALYAALNKAGVL